jgi:hypothetical protein
MTPDMGTTDLEALAIAVGLLTNDNGDSHNALVTDPIGGGDADAP